MGNILHNNRIELAITDLESQNHPNLLQLLENLKLFGVRYRDVIEMKQVRKM